MRRVLAGSIAGLLAGVSVSLALAASGAVPAGRWVIRELGTVDGLQSAAVGVNQRGQVVANAGDSMSTSGVSSYGAETHAFLWEKDRITPLGDLGGGHSRATAINDRGEIVGTSRTGKGESHAFLWRKGRMTDIGTLGADSASEAVAVNDRVQVVVNSYPSNPYEPGGRSSVWQARAFVWEGGRKRSLGAMPGTRFSRAMTINNRGQIAGLSMNRVVSPVASTGFLWQNGRMTALPAPAGQVVAPAYPNGLVMNANGEIVATISDRSGADRRAVLWRNGRLTVLGDGSGNAINSRGQVVFGSTLWWRGRSVELGMTGSGINDRGQVIGARWKEWQGRFQTEECARAAVWQSGRLVELGALRTTKPCNVPPYVNSYATANNEAGLVVGFSDSPRGHGAARAVLWRFEPAE